MSDLRFQVEEVFNLRKNRNRQEKALLPQKKRKTDKKTAILVRLLWRAAAPGLKPPDLRLPRARNCAASPNNRGQRRPKLSAIDVTARHSLSVCIWFQDSANLPFLSPCPRRPHPHRLLHCDNYVSISVKKFPGWPLKCLVSTIHQVIWPSPGTLEGATHERFGSCQRKKETNKVVDSIPFTGRHM